MNVLIPSSDDLRHPHGDVFRARIFPVMFEPGPQYPLRSPWRCFNCTCAFDTVPLFIPRSYSRERGVVEWFGNFCSAACRGRFLEDQREVQNEQYHGWIVQLDNILFPGLLRRRDAIASSAVELTMYGGRVTIAELDELREASCVRSLPVADHGLTFTYATVGVREIFHGEMSSGLGEEGVGKALIAAARDVQAGKAPYPTDPPTSLPSWLVLEWVDLARKPMRRWPERSPFRCWHCTRSFADTCPFMVPRDRDMLNTVRMHGNFCSPACGLTYLLGQHSTVGMPTTFYELVGLYLWICQSVLRIPLDVRFSAAPHRLERWDFGGDLSEVEFLAQGRISSLHTTLECPPFISVRMVGGNDRGGNYARPAVTCNLESIGTSTIEGHQIAFAVPEETLQRDDVEETGEEHQLRHAEHLSFFDKLMRAKGLA